MWYSKYATVYHFSSKQQLLLDFTSFVFCRVHKCDFFRTQAINKQKIRATDSIERESNLFTKTEKNKKNYVRVIRSRKLFVSIWLSLLVTLPWADSSFMCICCLIACFICYTMSLAQTHTHMRFIIIFVVNIVLLLYGKLQLYSIVSVPNVIDCKSKLCVRLYVLNT